LIDKTKIFYEFGDELAIVDYELRRETKLDGSTNYEISAISYFTHACFFRIIEDFQGCMLSLFVLKLLEFIFHKIRNLEITFVNRIFEIAFIGICFGLTERAFLGFSQSFFFFNFGWGRKLRLHLAERTLIADFILPFFSDIKALFHYLLELVSHLVIFNYFKHELLGPGLLLNTIDAYFQHLDIC
jgi:hypothetical protein